MLNILVKLNIATAILQIRNKKIRRNISTHVIHILLLHNGILLNKLFLRRYLNMMIVKIDAVPYSCLFEPVDVQVISIASMFQ